MTHKTAAVCLCAVLLGGCSSVNVVKNPSAGDNGIRYYRPKPYLLVTPADATGRMVKLEVLQLPDYCEEYSIHPKGKKPPAVQLQDGWNLVGVGGPGAPPKAEGAPPAPPTDPMKLPEAVLVAGNVPIGLYESVFDYAGPGKYLKGWRYVGFSPWGGGLPNGTDQAAVANLQKGCRGPGGFCASSGSVIQGPLYGIVFFNGAMTFRQIDEIANNMTCPEYVKPPVQGGVAPQPGGMVPVPGAPPTGPGIEAVPSSPAPPNPNPAPRSTSFRSVSPRSSQVDARVLQTATVSQSPAARMTSPVQPGTATAKPVDPKKLAALEAEVFQRLKYAPAAAADGSSSVRPDSSSARPSSTAAAVPDLTPAVPLR